MDSVVVVGASLAGLRAVEALRGEGYDGRIVVIGDEVHPPYDRPPLSKGLLTGATDLSAVTLRQRPDLAVEWRLGERAVALHAADREVLLDGGRRVPYDGLVVATGATARRLPAVPEGLAGVITLRTLDDAITLRRELAGRPSVVILGGGFIGTEVASSCRTLGLDVTLVTADPLLARALGPLSAGAAARAADHGVTVVHPATVTEVRGHDRVQEVVLGDGRTLPADVLVVAVGAVPATGWLRDSGASLDNGLICDAGLGVVGLPGVVAAGDVARWPHPAFGGAPLRLEHWTNAAEQAVIAARRLLHGTAAGPCAPVPSFWSDQFGIRLQGVGLPALADETRVIEGDPAGDRFVAEFFRTGELVGAVVAGAPRALLAYRRRLTHPQRVPAL
ncbi:3-phenylpropionate/trans-cinnamate dioxygenase ferredoxin reductase subunit [Streptosporangium subroseum]|uniref:3-phenylpropionate/trans-cinnamate dioxygenase ferredoxin reductase subunit n=1 Tax=Streptosporangium subroseum TaxID=106412 RepID=A0A239D0J7_9ACTN|nr:FAD-dependent oxidoreductase [Streptosporangium subroseum]SNS25324.1 3-phenylpropionate/trans-cinnamate dioxygenase ferredoxin reductase subunit [Streptosporangium subroseum]